MPSPAANSSPACSDRLRRDLSLLGSRVRQTSDFSIVASIAGKPATIEQALAAAGSLLRASHAPALLGMADLTIEAARPAVALAQNLGASLYPWPAISNPLIQRQPVTQTATLGFLLTSELIVWVGCDGGAHAHPIAQALAHRQPLASFLPAELSTVADLRARVASSTEFNPFQPHKKAAVILPHDADPRLVSQWHKLAASLQRLSRVSVFQLPHPDAGNLRGITETITWLTTGTALKTLDLEHSLQTSSTPNQHATIQPSAAFGCVDLLIDLRSFADAPPVPADLPRITIAPRSDPHAQVAFLTPGLALGLAARVMRHDGLVMWLCDDPDQGMPDPVTELLRRLGQEGGSL